MGTREHIIAYLTGVGELFDANGMASTQLAAAVGYPGSSVAFAQLLSGMERSGLIEREVRGKRTYRIRLGAVSGHERGGAGADLGGGVPGGAAGGGAAFGGTGAALGGTGAAFGGTGAAFGGTAAFGVAGGARAAGSGGFDYDELARRLLVQVVRRLAATEPDASHPERSALEETVSGLEYELADAWTKHGKLAEENVRLREQLRAAQRSLALAAEQVGRLPVGTDLDSKEIGLLQRLLAVGAAPADTARDGVGAGSGAQEPGAASAAPAAPAPAAAEASASA